MTIGAGDEDFAPPPWLRNAHVQSIYPSLPLRRPGVARATRGVVRASRRFTVDCGDGVRLLALHAEQTSIGRPPASRLAVLLHGWEGSANSLYILSLAQHLFDRDFDVVRLNLRDHGDSHDLNAELFHSCRIVEVVGAVRRLQALFPDRELGLAGFSLGGNFCLRVGARAAAAGIDVSRIVAVCPVLDPARTLAALEHGWVVYRRYFVRKWHRSLHRKRDAWPDRYDFRDMLHLHDLTSMTDHLVRKYTEYPTLQDYFRGYAIVDGALSGLAAPCRIIVADDDPIIPVDDLERLPALPNLRVTRTKFGGHCGFYDGGSGPSWIERCISRELESRRG